MEILLERYNAGIAIKPAPDYLRKFLKYSHRGIEKVGYRSQMVFSEKLLYSTDSDGSIFTLPGFFKDITTRIEKNMDTVRVVDYRDSMPEPDWKAVKRAVKLRDYQKAPVIDLITEGMEDGGVVFATGGFGA